MSNNIAPASATSLPGHCIDGDVRLNSSSNVRSGRIEICINREWGTLCDDFWDNRDASVVCRQLGFSPHGNTHSDHNNDCKT